MKPSLLHVFSGSMQLICSLYIWIWRSLIGRLMDPKEPEKITNEECEKKYLQDVTLTRSELEPADTVDFPVNKSMQEALEGVSEAIYKLCFSKWHCPPEDIKKQPLFLEINNAIRNIFYNIKARVRPLEEYEILIAVVEALIIHLKNFRKNRIIYRYNTPQEEVDFLRNQTKNLLLYWLPDSLRDSSHIMVFLNEIISINVLRPTINNLANPTFINETIVRNLGSGEALEMKDDFEAYSGLHAPCANRPNASDAYMYEYDSIPCRMKKKSFVQRVKGLLHPSKDKKHKECSAFRSFQRASEEDATDCTDDHTNTEIFDESAENYIVSSVSDSVLQKWLQENWTAKISENPTQDRHTYKICVSKGDCLKTKLCITERSVKDFRQIYNIICMKYPDLKTFPILEKTEEAEMDDDRQFFQAIGIHPEKFIETLLELIKLHKNPEPVFFFSPFSYEEGGREVFFKTFSEDNLSQEDSSTVKSETEEELDKSADDPKGYYENDGYRSLQSIKKKIMKKKSKEGPGSELEDTFDENMSAKACSGEDQAPPMLEKKGRGITKAKKSRRGAVRDLRGDGENNTKRKELEDMFLNSLYHLADELFSGGNSIFRFLQSAGILKNKSKAILNAIPKLYEEDQIVWYLNQTSELLLADVCPLPVPPQKLPLMAQEILKSKLQSLLTSTVIKYFFEKKILKNITASHEAFQNLKAIKETLFKILEDITRIITNGSQEMRR